MADRGRCPAVPSVGRSVHLPAGGAEVQAAGIERVDGHRVAQHVDVAVALRQTLRQRLPLVAARAAAVHAQLALGRIVFRVARDRDDVDGVRLVRVHLDREAEVGRQVPADLVPRRAGVIATHDVQCFCMNSTCGRDGCIAMRCTQWPTSACGLGMPSDRRPRFIGRHVGRRRRSGTCQRPRWR